MQATNGKTGDVSSAISNPFAIDEFFDYCFWGGTTISMAILSSQDRLSLHYRQSIGFDYSWIDIEFFFILA
jgi:hypothetical protein